MILIEYDKKIVIVGYSGAGKSTLLGFFIKKIAKAKFFAVIVDTTSKFSRLKHIRYKGKTECLYKNPNSVCIKIQSEEDLENIIKNINDKDRLPMLLIVDEIDQFTDVHSLMPETSLFFQQGRNYRHGGIFTIRQIGRLNKQILSNSQILILFKIYNRNDIEYLCSITGMDLRQEINELKPHEFFIIDLTNSENLGKFILKGNDIDAI